MNYVLIAVIAILATGAIVGWKKGFVDMLFGAVSMLLALALAVIIGPKLGAAVQGSENIMNKLTTKVSATLNLDELAIEIPQADVFIDNLNLPIVIKEKITSSEFVENMEINSLAETASDKMAEVVAVFLAKLIVSAVCFVIVFVVALILIYIADKILDLFTKLPLLKQANQLAGLALGVCQAILVVWMFFAVITMAGGTSFGQTMFGYISDSELLDFLYKNNIPMNYITKTAAKLF